MGGGLQTKADCAECQLHTPNVCGNGACHQAASSRWDGPTAMMHAGICRPAAAGPAHLRALLAQAAVLPSGNLPGSQHFCAKASWLQDVAAWWRFSQKAFSCPGCWSVRANCKDPGMGAANAIEPRHLSFTALQMRWLKQRAALPCRCRCNAQACCGETHALPVNT